MISTNAVSMSHTRGAWVRWLSIAPLGIMLAAPLPLCAQASATGSVSGLVTGDLPAGVAGNCPTAFTLTRQQPPRHTVVTEPK